MRTPFRLTVSVLLLSFGLGACAPAKSANPRVFFSSPVHVTLGSENFTIEPAGVVKAGAGHLHIMVDTPCLSADSAIPKDAQHLHYGQGQLAADLELSPGQHTLCLQAADGTHIALSGAGLTQQIKVTVK